MCFNFKPNINKHFSNLYNTSGQSIISILLGVVMSTGMLLTISKLLLQTSTSSELILIQTTINNLHMEGLHKVNSLKEIQSTLGLEATLGYSTNPALVSCFAGNGSNCQGLQINTWQEFSDPSHELNATYSKTGKCTGFSSSPICSIKIKTGYILNCPSSYKCESIKINVQTFYNDGSVNPSFKFKARDSTVEIPGFLLVSKGEFNMSCASPNLSVGSLVSGIDYTKLLYTCTPFTGLNQSKSSNASEPLKVFATIPGSSSDWQSLESVDCPNFGIKKIGLFQNQSTCLSLGTNIN